MTFGQLAKYTSAMYAELPPGEKDAWMARAEADKSRYLHELASYSPPPGYDAKGDVISQPMGAKGGRKGKTEKGKSSGCGVVYFRRAMSNFGSYVNEI